MAYALGAFSILSRRGDAIFVRDWYRQVRQPWPILKRARGTAARETAIDLARRGIGYVVVGQPRSVDDGSRQSARCTHHNLNSEIRRNEITDNSFSQSLDHDGS